MMKLQAGNTALVVPAFEYTDLKEGLDSTNFPQKKEELLKLVDSKRLDMFHASWKPGHGPSDYAHWYEANEIYKVAKYQYQYEPYVIFPRNSVWCDERFVGYGANKAACLFELYLSGVEYWVLPEDFLIHQTHKYLEDARKHE
ncbi:1160_t:CDS:2, partial [Acaulospora colombiana]